MICNIFVHLIKESLIFQLNSYEGGYRVEFSEYHRCVVLKICLQNPQLSDTWILVVKYNSYFTVIVVRGEVDRLVTSIFNSGKLFKHFFIFHVVAHSLIWPLKVVKIKRKSFLCAVIMQNRSFTSIMYYSAGDKKQTPIKDFIKVVLCQTNSPNFINNYKS